uniref:Uncharacterized protein n=1 Tax=viral metagenome TaxID=1070528 RepID=A0A6H1ZZI8_9ZZZZ
MPSLEWECGATTCAIRRGVFCRFLWSKKCGRIPWCHLFDARIREHAAGPHAGWAARLPECLELDGKAADDE